MLGKLSVCKYEHLLITIHRSNYITNLIIVA